MNKTASNIGVLLWDLDGTLLRVKRKNSTSPHKNALSNRGFFLNDSEMRLSGQTDFEIFLELTKLASDEVDKEIFLQAFEDLDKESLRLDKSSTFHLLPGVVDILDNLASRGWINGVLTGNTESRLKAKIKNSGIASFFIEDYLFGCEFGDSRESITKKAERYCSQKHQSNVFILGDTPYDISAARSSHFPIISVATGDFSIEELSSHKPDLLLQNLSRDADMLIKYLEKRIFKMNRT
jgi:phosphoglycolate phosphatase